MYKNCLLLYTVSLIKDCQTNFDSHGTIICCNKLFSLFFYRNKCVQSNNIDYILSAETCPVFLLSV